MLKELEQKMLAASEELKFEEAADYRDLMQSIQKIGGTSRRSREVRERTKM